MDDSLALAGLWACSITRYTLAVLWCLVRWTRPHARPIVLQQMLRTVPDAGRTVRVLAIGIRFPEVVDWIVALHRRTLLFALAIIVKVLTSETVFLSRTGAATGAEQMATFARLRTEATALRALGRAVQFAELLAIVRSLAPTTDLARVMARRTFTLGRGKVERIPNVGLRIGQYLLPVDRAHVAQVVVVEDARRTTENVAQGRHLECVHLRERHKQAELVVPLVQLEGGPTTDDL
uniref:Putative secreted peptide n=1 Tax=Anopheles braziliensis TaxID=58242 RepID=A0A2M3ZPM3_9DIPT